MKSKFPGYYKPNAEEFNSLWEDSFFVLDTNVLLDLYRLSPETSNSVLEVLRQIKDKLWIPYQVAFEYHKHLVPVIQEQITAYRESSKQIDVLNTMFLNKRKHPFLSKRLEERTKRLFKDIKKYYDTQETKMYSNLLDKSVKDDLCDILEGRVGDDLSDSEKEVCYKDCDNRFQNNIPPGYMDKKKDGKEKYGDYLVWKEILLKSKEDNSPAIFITDDLKEDWFFKIDNRIIGPNPFLIKEFYDETGQNVYIYSLDNFLKIASERKLKIDKKIIAEIQKRNSYQDVNNNFVEYFKDDANSQLYKVLQTFDNLPKTFQIIEEYRSTLDNFAKYTDFFKLDKNKWYLENTVSSNNSEEGNTDINSQNDDDNDDDPNTPVAPVLK